MADNVAWPLGKLVVKTRAAGLTKSGRARANANLRRLFSAIPPSTAHRISQASAGLRAKNRYPTTASDMIPSTMVLPRLVMLRAASRNHGGPMGMDGLAGLRKARMTLLSNVNSSPSLTSWAMRPNAKSRTDIVNTEIRIHVSKRQWLANPLQRSCIWLAPRKKPLCLYHRTAAGGVCSCPWPYPPMIRPTNKRGCFNGRKWSTGGHDTSAITAWRHLYIDSRQRGQKPPHSRLYRPLSPSARTIIARELLDTAAFRIELPTRRNRCNGIVAGL